MANALYNALGIRFHDLPLSPETVYLALSSTYDTSSK
jgi:CO/xanthine dehydrogenase Mo-binding subunit